LRVWSGITGWRFESFWFQPERRGEPWFRVAVSVATVHQPRLKL
jgi:hypothetical protein